MNYFKNIVITLLMALGAVATYADDALKNTSSFGEYTIHYSTFNSTFIKPDIAAAYKLTRAKNQTLINLSVTRTIDSKTSFGIAATINGTATNLMQQQRRLKFVEIREKNAVYYIASLPHSNEEVFHFSIEVTPEGSEKSHTLTFNKKLYRGE